MTDNSLGEVVGYVDFFLNTRLNWAIEIAMEGRDIPEHLNRFHPATGKYRHLHLTNYAVVDIRLPGDSKPPKESHERLITLYFSEHFLSARMVWNVDDQTKEKFIRLNF